MTARHLFINHTQLIYFDVQINERRTHNRQEVLKPEQIQYNQSKRCFEGGDELLYAYTLIFDLISSLFWYIRIKYRPSIS